MSKRRLSASEALEIVVEEKDEESPAKVNSNVLKP